MSVRLCIGLTKQAGQKNYSSLGASCTIDVEVDSAALGDQTRFQDDIRRPYEVASQALTDELSRQDRCQLEPVHPTGHSTANGASPYGATSKQLEYAKQLAKSIPGHGVHGLEQLSQHLYAKPLAGVSSVECSSIIDLLKDVKAGKVELPGSLTGSTQ